MAKPTPPPPPQKKQVPRAPVAPVPKGGKQKAPPPPPKGGKKVVPQTPARKAKAPAPAVKIDLSIGGPTADLARKMVRRLNALRRHYFATLFTEGLASIIGAALGLVFLQCLADYIFDLPWLARLGFALMDIVLLAGVFYAKIVRPLKRKFTVDRAALRVEKRWPALNSALISSVQLSRPNDGFPRGSEELIRALLIQTTEKIKGLNFKDVVNLERRNKAIVTAGALALLMALPIIFFPSASTALLMRCALFNVQLPSKTRVLPVTQTIYAAVGSDVLLSARASGIIPSHGKVLITARGLTKEFPISHEKEDPELFCLPMKNVQESFSYQFRLGDGKGEEFSGYVENPPVLSSLKVEIAYPAYTKLGTKTVPTDGLSVLAGSVVKVSIVASSKLKTATIVQEGIKGDIPMKLGLIDHSQASGEMKIALKGLTGFSVNMVSANGIPSAQNVVYKLDIVPDKAPVINLLAPDNEKETITIRFRSEISLNVSDDFGVSTLNLCIQTTTPVLPRTAEEAQRLAAEEAKNPPAEAPITKVPIPFKAGEPQVTYPWDLGTLNLKEGDVVNYWIEATDNNTATGPGVASSRHQQFAVISAEAKSKELADRLKENASKIQDLSGTQQKVRSAVGQAIKANTD